MAARKSPNDATQLDHAAGAVACLLAIPIVVELLGLVLLTGVFDIAPRAAALYLIAPALLLGVAGAFSRSARKFVGKYLTLFWPT